MQGTQGPTLQTGALLTRLVFCMTSIGFILGWRLTVLSSMSERFSGPGWKGEWAVNMFTWAPLFRCGGWMAGD